MDGADNPKLFTSPDLLETETKVLGSPGKESTQPPVVTHTGCLAMVSRFTSN